jgi:hypothetical protein
MTRAEIDLGIDWAAAEGWNPGLHDAESFYAADPGGFLVGLLDNEPVGMISAVKYGHSFGFDVGWETRKLRSYSSSEMLPGSKSDGMAWRELFTSRSDATRE